MLQCEIIRKILASSVDDSTVMPCNNNSPPRKKRSQTVGSTFSRQLNNLVANLDQTNPFFIRCIKPNTEKKPNQLDPSYVLPQLKNGGIVEALRILKLGFPTRCDYDQVWKRYSSIISSCGRPLDPETVNKRDFTEAILQHCGSDALMRNEYQLGLTKVFFRPGKQAFLEKLLQSGERLDSSTAEKVMKFLLMKHFFRVRSAIRVNLVFARRLRQMRAAKRVKQVFGVSYVVSKTFVHLLRRSRERKLKKAVLTIQSSWRSIASVRNLQQQKDGIRIIADFYRDYSLKRTLVNRITSRVNHRQVTSLQQQQERELLAQEMKKKREASRENTIQEYRRRLAAFQRQPATVSAIDSSSDPVVELLSKGQNFTVKDGPPVFVWVDTCENRVVWVSEDEQTIGSVPLRRLERAHFRAATSTSPCVVTLLQPNDEPMLSLQIPSMSIALRWRIALRYSLQSVKATGKLIRPADDPMRANQLAWKLMIQNEDMSRKLTELEARHRHLQEHARMLSSATSASPNGSLVRARGARNDQTSPNKHRSRSPEKALVDSSEHRRRGPSGSEACKENDSRSAQVDVDSASTGSTAIVPIMVCFPDGSRLSVKVSAKDTASIVVRKVASLVKLGGYEGMALFEVDPVTRKENVLRANDRVLDCRSMQSAGTTDNLESGNTPRLLFKRHSKSGMVSEPAAVSLVYWQTVYELVEGRLGVGEAELVELMALHRTIASSPIIPIGPLHNNAEIAQLKKLNPYLLIMNDIEAKERMNPNANRKEVIIHF